MIVCVRVDYTYLDSQRPRERMKSICERLSWNGRTKRNSPRSKRGGIGWMVAMLPMVGCWSLAAWSKKFFDCFRFMPPHLWKGVCVFVGRCQNDGCGGEFHGATFKYSHRLAGSDHPQRSVCLLCPDVPSPCTVNPDLNGFSAIPETPLEPSCAHFVQTFSRVSMPF